MTETDPERTESGNNLAERQAEPRSPRSIRFADSEWARIEREARARGMSAGEFVRHAAVSFATGRLTANAPAFPSEIAAQIERVYRGVYLLSTLKREQMLREGRQEEYDRIRKDCHKSQDSIRNDASEPIS